MGLMHRESFPVNGVFCAQPQKFCRIRYFMADPPHVLKSIWNAWYTYLMEKWHKKLSGNIFQLCSDILTVNVYNAEPWW